MTSLVYATLTDVKQYDNDAGNDMEVVEIIKPSPIFVNNEININEMIKRICSVIASGLCVSEVNQIYYSSKLSYHTFQLKRDYGYRFVKGLRHSTNAEEVCY